MRKRTRSTVYGENEKSHPDLRLRRVDLHLKREVAHPDACIVSVVMVHLASNEDSNYVMK